MMNMQNMMRQAQKLQKQMEKKQAELLKQPLQAHLPKTLSALFLQGIKN